MKKNIKILHLEDDINDFELIKSTILDVYPSWNITFAENKNDFLEALSKTDFDIILSDFKLPQFNTFDAVKIAKEKAPVTPFILISGTIGEELAVEALKSGITDFVLKDKLFRLIPVINRALSESRIKLKQKQMQESLKRSEEKYRNLVDNSLVGIYQSNLKGEILYANEALLKIFEYGSLEDLSKNSIKLIRDPDERSLFFDNLIKNKRVKNVEMELVTKNGKIKNIITSSSLVEDIVSGMIIDITERKGRELKIEQQNRRLNALRNIDLAITSSLDLRVTLNVFLDNVTEQLKVDAAVILLMNPFTQMLEYAARRGFYTDALEHTMLHIGQGYAGRAAKERQVIFIKDLKKEDEILNRMLKISPSFKDEGFRSYVAIPLVAKGNVMGVLEIFNRKILNFEQDWIDFLEALATQAAIAVENANLFNDLQRSNIEILLAYDLTLEGWSKALDMRDKATEGHTIRVTEITMKIAKALDIEDSMIAHIRRGALLHDIGKLGIPDNILLKPGPLNDEEWEIMKNHPTLAFELLSPISYLKPALNIPYCHHEKWNGTGYPRKLKGKHIPLEARIFAVADVWDALCSDRPYRKAWTQKEIEEYMISESGRHFDPEVLEVFLKLKGDFDFSNYHPR